MTTAIDQRAWLMKEYSLIDPVTFQMVGSSLISACREMGITMMRTAYSPIFVDGMDFSCGLLDGTGEMIAQGEFCPVHLNSMAYSAQWALIEHGAETLLPGDVLIHNDPYRGGTHLNDFNVMKPIFVDGSLVAIACNRAHQIDMGGKARAGFAGDATEVFQEGIRVPPIKWFREGKEDLNVADFLLANVRQPHIQRGDLTAQLATCISAERRLVELCTRYGTDLVLECFRAMKDYSERRVRASLVALPDGEWFFDDVMDNDGVVDSPVKIAVKIKKDKDFLLVDFSESSPQVAGPINATYGITASMVFTALLQVCESGIPVNHGAFRPVRIIAPRGTITNAQFPAPTMGGNTVTSMAIYQAVMGAFAQASPQSAVASSYSSHHFTGGGRNESGDWLFYFFTDGGWGGHTRSDGWSGIFQVNGNCKDYPAEVIETTLPLRYESVRLRGDLAGAGKMRGGCGTERIITFLEDGEVNSICERNAFRPYGLVGGKAAGANDLRIRRDEDEYSFPELTGAKFPVKFANQALAAGDTVSIVTTGGGGFGSPLERDPQSVLSDVLDELCTEDDALNIYGVRLVEDKGFLTVDKSETDEQRRARQSEAANEGILDRGIPDASPKDLPSGPSTEGDMLARSVHSLMRGRPDPYCKNQCPLKADGHRCPMWNEEALDYWTVSNLVRWLDRKCPASGSFDLKGLSQRLYK